MSWVEYVTLARLQFGVASLQVVRALFHIGTLRLQLRHYPLALEKFAEAAAVANGMYGDARASGDKAAAEEICSQLALVLEGLGVACTKLKRWDDAASHLDEALAISRDHPSTTALVARAELHCARMQYEDGLKLLEQAFNARGGAMDEHRYLSPKSLTNYPVTCPQRENIRGAGQDKNAAAAAAPRVLAGIGARSASGFCSEAGASAEGIGCRARGCSS